jgi:hypothetical protein
MRELANNLAKSEESLTLHLLNLKLSREVYEALGQSNFLFVNLFSLKLDRETILINN